MNKIYLALALHSHQPLGNFDNVFEEGYQKSYLPFLAVIEQYPFLKLNLHYSGTLLDWLESRHPEYFDRLLALYSQGRVEMISGGHYEPILSILPVQDALAQIGKLSNKLAGIFGKKPLGCWLAERVWEQPLAAILHAAAVDYVILDDIHFLCAGLQPEELTRYFITEEQGKTLKLIPGSKQLRYTIPFADPWVTIEYLRRIAEREANALVVMADDCEKFGGWPKTYQHVYEDRWLHRFIAELGKNRDWIETICLSNYLEAHPPSQKVYLPNASYSEMMEWALPVRSREHQHLCQERLRHEPDAEHLLPFVRGGYWRNFLAKYREVDFLYNKMLLTSQRLETLRPALPLGHSGGELSTLYSNAYECLLRAQCNDAYWHGVFGGVYAPHLRTAMFSNLIEANHLADTMERMQGNGASLTGLKVEVLDVDTDGSAEMLLHTAQVDLFIDPDDGATVREIDFKPCAAPLINSLTRQPEYYHRYLYQDAGSSPDPNIRGAHGKLTAQEQELDRALRYDHYAKHCFRTCLFPCWKSIEDYDRQHLEEIPRFASDRFEWNASPSRAQEVFPFTAAGSLFSGGVQRPLHLIKKFQVESAAELTRVYCDMELSSEYPFESDWKLGVENVINFLAATADDRFISSWAEDLAEATGEPESPSFKVSLNWQGIVERLRTITFTDGWRRIETRLCFEQPVDWWIVPVFTVSQSEGGFERIYQGTQVLAVLPGLNWKEGKVAIRHWMEIRKLS